MKDRLLQMVACPICDHLVYPHSKRCMNPSCRTLFAAGSLNGLRIPKHANPVRVPRDWVKRFLGV